MFSLLQQVIELIKTFIETQITIIQELLGSLAQNIKLFQILTDNLRILPTIFVSFVPPAFLWATAIIASVAVLYRVYFGGS